MRATSPGLLILPLLLLLAAPARAITIELPPPPCPGLDRDAIFARIDSLEAVYDRTAPDDRADVAFALGELYAATGMIKHQDTAIDYFDEVTRLDPTRSDAVYRSAIELCRWTYYARALDRVEDLVEREPEVLGHLLMLARLEFISVRMRNYEFGMDRPYQLYVTALGRAPDDDEALFGAAATSLLVGNHQLARSCADRLRTHHPDWPEPWLIGAAAAFRRDNHQQAWIDFLQGLARAPEEYRRAFLGAQELVPAESLVSMARATIEPERARKVSHAAEGERIDWLAVVDDPGVRAELVERWWTRRDDSAESFENESELEFWTRMVEVDLVYGRPESSIRGWETLPGEVQVRLGEPLSTYHFIKFFYEADTQLAPGPTMEVVTRYRNFLAIPPPRHYWTWNYVIDGQPLRVVFHDFTYGAPRWAVSAGSQLDVGALRHRVAFVEPGRTGPPPAFRLGVQIARFPRGENSLLETSIAVRALGVADPVFGAPDSVIVEWTLTDAAGRTVDEAVRRLTPDRSLAALMRASGQPAALLPDEPRLALVGAVVPPGEYRVLVRALDPGTGRFSSETFAVSVPAEQTGDLALSSIQLSHGLPEWDPASDFPLELVKHGRDLLCAPRAVIEGSKLGVYYEVENLGRDASGRTRFDVEYAIYEGTGQVRLLAMLGDFDPDEVEEVELATVEYLHEQTGVSPEGLVVKGTEIDISDLGEGDYVLRVKVTDLLSGRECASAVAFRRPAGAVQG